MTEPMTHANPTKCVTCKHYDASPYQEYDGKLARCRGDSYLYKVGHHTLASRECYEKREEV